MEIKIKFDDGETKKITYSGEKSFPEWLEDFFKARYFVINKTSEVGNLVIDTQKVKYLEIV